MFDCPAETSSLFGQKVEEGAEQANGVQWETAHYCRDQRVSGPALIIQSNRCRPNIE